MPKCTFCNKDYEFPRGTTVVNSISGAIYYYCSSKCRKNAEMKRKKRKWSGKKKHVKKRSK
ncbi:TPA: 50S ribosomal protein L24e [Patescibacteria group bacterium]|nr:50S ribosomal protein L24e [Patescibacteria group bacterium]